MRDVAVHMLTAQTLHGLNTTNSISSPSLLLNFLWFPFFIFHTLLEFHLFLYPEFPFLMLYMNAFSLNLKVISAMKIHDMLQFSFFQRWQSFVLKFCFFLNYFSLCAKCFTTFIFPLFFHYCIFLIFTKIWPFIPKWPNILDSRRKTFTKTTPHPSYCQHF